MGALWPASELSTAKPCTRAGATGAPPLTDPSAVTTLPSRPPLAWCRKHVPLHGQAHFKTNGVAGAVHGAGALFHLAFDEAVRGRLHGESSAVSGPAGTSSAEVMRVSGSARLLASVAHDCRVAGVAAESWGRAASDEPPQPMSKAAAAAEIARGGGHASGFFSSSSAWCCLQWFFLRRKEPRNVASTRCGWEIDGR